MLVMVLAVCTTLLACTFFIVTAWLRTAEMHAMNPHGKQTPGEGFSQEFQGELAIEYAALKERVRRLERIADGQEA